MTADYNVDANGYYGEFGGAYLDQSLANCVDMKRQQYNYYPNLCA